jgi:hypothetical protein
VAGAETVVRGNRQRKRAVDLRDLLDTDRVTRHVEPGAAVLLRDADAQESELGEARNDLRGEALFLVPSLGLGGDLRANEVADGPAKKAVMLGKSEVHGRGKLLRS